MTKLGIIIADFQTSLAGKIAIGGTTGSLLSATDDDGVILPDGRYFFTIDSDNSSKEHISCDLVGTTKAITNIKSVARGTGVETAGTLREHRIGATVTITDFAHIKKIQDLLDGTTDLDGSNPLKYDTDPAITDDKELATKKYVDDVAIAGGADASTTTKGFSKLSTNPVSPTEPIAVGDNDPRIPTTDEKSALVGNNTDIAVGTGNKFVTQTGLQHNAEKYAADNEASDDYVITLSPAPTSYTNGMVVYFYAKTANTGAATLNVNGLGAKTIVKHLNTTLVDGDIVAGMLCTVIYDGTNFVLQNPVARTVSTDASGKLPAIDASQLTNSIICKVGRTTYDLSTDSGSQTIAHGLGKTPKFVRIITSISTLVANVAPMCSYGTFDGTTYCGYYFDTSTAGTGHNMDSFIAKYQKGNLTQDATISIDATNITLNWKKTNSPNGILEILWEAIA